jgi:formylmethanofuran dehydrogenase subunit E
MRKHYENINNNKNRKRVNKMENQISCDNCDFLENESELIETFDNELLCSPCYIKKEFNTESEE